MKILTIDLLRVAFLVRIAAYRGYYRIGAVFDANGGKCITCGEIDIRTRR